MNTPIEEGFKNGGQTPAHGNEIKIENIIEERNDYKLLFRRLLHDPGAAKWIENDLWKDINATMVKYHR